MTTQPIRPHAGVFARLLPDGIEARLFLLIALVLLPLLLLLAWISYQRYETRRSAALETEMEVAQGIATTFSTYVEGVQQQNYVVGQAILAASGGSTASSGSAAPSDGSSEVYVAATHLLSLTAAHLHAVRNLNWVNPLGVVLASSQKEIVGSDLSSRAYFQQLIAGQPWAIGDLTSRGIVTNSPTLAIATAIRDERGALRGVVVAGIEPNRLGELIIPQQRPDSGGSSIFDRNGVLIYNSPETSLTWEERLQWQESDPVLQQVMRTGQEQTGITHLALSDGEWLVARVPVPGLGFVAGTRRPVEVALTPVQQSLIQDALIALLVAGIACLSAALLAQTIARPLYRLEQDAQVMGTGRAEPREDPQAPTEVRSLRGTVENMATRLIQHAQALGEREAALRKSEAQLRGLVEANIIGVVSRDIEGKLLDANDAFVKMVGYTREEVHAGNLHTRNLVPEEYLPLEKQIVEEVLATGSSRPYEKEYIHKDGRRIPILIGYTRLAGSSDDLIGFVLDLTELKKAQAALAEYAEALKYSNQELEQFAFIASHDLQEPLRKIRMFGNRLREKLARAEVADRLPEEAIDSLERMQNAAERMQKMINGLLELSRVSTQGQTFEPVILTQLVEEAVSDLEARIQATGGRVYIEPLPTAEVDLLQIRQLFQNLVGNALKFHKPDVPPLIEVSGIVTRTWSGSHVDILVKDNGIGFEEQYAERIFQPFQRLHGMNEYEGTGLGLAICNKIVERHHGKIKVHSKPGEGSTFVITLPLQQME